jgi:hypothetical protein
MCKWLPLSRGMSCIDLDYWAGLGMHIFGSMAARRYILLVYPGSVLSSLTPRAEGRRAEDQHDPSTSVVFAHFSILKLDT